MGILKDFWTAQSKDEKHGSKTNQKECIQILQNSVLPVSAV